MRAVVKRRLIPSREEVMRAIKVACWARPEDTFVAPAFVNVKGRQFGNFRPLYLATYGLRHDKELIPNTGRFFFIPLLPVLTDPGMLPRHWRLVRTNSFDAEGFKRLFERAYSKLYDGEAFVAKGGDLLVVMNTNEKKGAFRAVRDPFMLGGPLRLLKGRWASTITL